MRGTTSALRLLFGYDVGADYSHEFISVNQEQVHLFECFSFVNYLMCSAIAEKSNQGIQRRKCGKTAHATSALFCKGLGPQ